MCTIVAAAWAATAIAAAGTTASVVQQNQQAKSTAAYEEQQSENDLKAYQDNQAQTGYANEQARQSASQQEYQNNLKARAAMSTARAQASEAGVEGNFCGCAPGRPLGSARQLQPIRRAELQHDRSEQQHPATEQLLRHPKRAQLPPLCGLPELPGSGQPPRLQRLGAYSTQLRANSGSTTVTPNGS